MIIDKQDIDDESFNVLDKISEWLELLTVEELEHLVYLTNKQIVNLSNKEK